MMNVVIGILAVFLFVYIVWGLASRRRSLPCPVWLRWLVELDNPFSKISHASTIVEQLDLTPGMTVLDMGCGPGRVTIPLAQAVGEQGQITAVDLQAGMLERARIKAENAGVKNINFIQVAAGDDMLGQNIFDRAVLVTVLGEIPDRDGAIKEIFDALKPGGILSITEIVFDPHFQRRSTVRKIALGCGFHQKNLFGNAFAYTMHLEKPRLG